MAIRVAPKLFHAALGGLAPLLFADWSSLLMDMPSTEDIASTGVLLLTLEYIRNLAHRPLCTMTKTAWIAWLIR